MAACRSDYNEALSLLRHAVLRHVNDFTPGIAVSQCLKSVDDNLGIRCAVGCVCPELHCESANVLEEDRSWSHELHKCQVGVYKVVPLICLPSTASGGESLAGRAANDQIYGAAKFSQFGCFLSEQRFDVPIRRLQPRGPIEVFLFVDEVGFQRLECGGVPLDRKKPLPTREVQAGAKAATAGKEINVCGLRLHRFRRYCLTSGKLSVLDLFAALGLTTASPRASMVYRARTCQHRPLESFYDPLSRRQAREAGCAPEHRRYRSCTASRPG